MNNANEKEGDLKNVSSLRRYYPDQVLRVYLSNPPTGGKHPGNFYYKSMTNIGYKSCKGYF